MKILRKISEDEMIATFLQAEIDSPRFGERLDSYLKINNLGFDLITRPNLNDENENKIRREFLTSYRGYDNRLALFKNFPENIHWCRAELTRDEIHQIRYINYDYWNELSNNSRLASVAAKNIQAGKTVFETPNENFLEAAKALRGGKEFPEVILVAKDQQSPLVVLEGNLRLTALALAPEKVQEKMTAIVGFSNEITNWGLY